MGERPDEVRREQLGGLGRGSDPLAVGGPEGATPEPGLSGGAAVDDTEANRVEIERTRADMSETVDAIQERLSPENLKEQAKDRVKEATVGRAQGASSSIMEAIRENPLPAALTGIGLGWLLMSARRQQGSGRPRYQDRRYYDYDYPPGYDYPSRYEEERGRSSGALAGGQEALERTRDRVGETASRAQDRVGESASRAQDRAGQITDRAQDRVSRLGERAQQQARRASSGFERMLRENPLTVGAVAVGVGAGVGLAVPQTRQEDEVMGEARDNLVEKVQETAQEAQQKVQRVAEEAQSAAEDEVQNQGLTQQ